MFRKDNIVLVSELNAPDDFCMYLETKCFKEFKL